MSKANMLTCMIMKNVYEFCCGFTHVASCIIGRNVTTRRSKKKLKDKDNRKRNDISLCSVHMKKQIMLKNTIYCVKNKGSLPVCGVISIILRHTHTSLSSETHLSKG